MHFVDILKLIIGAAIGIAVLAGALQLLIVAVLAVGVLTIAVLIYWLFKRDE